MDPTDTVDEQIALRPGLPSDNYTCFKIYVEALFDHNYRADTEIVLRPHNYPITTLCRRI